MLTTTTLLKIALELTLGVCMKLFCDNGRIAWADFRNDFLFWLPGVDPVDGDGLSREVMANYALTEPTATPHVAAAKLAAK